MNTKTLAVGLAVLGAMGVQHVKALEIDYGQNQAAGSQLAFNKSGSVDSFNFTGPAATTSTGQFKVFADDAAGTAIGDYGSLASSGFTVTSLMHQSLGGNNYFDSGTVAGSGVVTIVDHAGVTFTANVSFNSISETYGPQIKNTGIDGVTANLTSITYTGTEADLKTLAKEGVGSLTIDWTYNGKGLAGLFAFDSNVNYKGIITNAVPDGGMTLVMLGAALSGVVLMKRKIA